MKYGRHTAIRTSPGVTTCVVVWIEICSSSPCSHPQDVTTCVVVWIEIVHTRHWEETGPVTTCVVVWIEILMVT